MHGLPPRFPGSIVMMESAFMPNMLDQPYDRRNGLKTFCWQSRSMEIPSRPGFSDGRVGTIVSAGTSMVMAWLSTA